MTDTLTAVPDEASNGSQDPAERYLFDPEGTGAVLLRSALLAGLVGIGCLLIGAAMSRLLDSTGDDDDHQGDGADGKGSAAA